MITTQAIEVRYMSPTPNKPTRIKLFDRQFNEFIVLTFDYEIGNVLTQAKGWLEEKGYKCYTSSVIGDSKWMLAVDFDDKFKNIKEVE